MKEPLEHKSSADSRTRRLGSQFTPGILDEVPSIPMMNIINQLKAWPEWKPYEGWCRTHICVLDELNEVLWSQLVSQLAFLTQMKSCGQS